ncbi:Brefeldin A resistance protein [Rutstroemia sp. NJR-2017a WRK4]|nr:Brefeldin A resistance protein [Rutstroemia sp. NJR-2017a WRK4]
MILHRQTTPDFLTAVTVPSERVVWKDHVGLVPRTPDEFSIAFRQSIYFQKLEDNIASYRQMAAYGTADLAAFYVEVNRSFEVGRRYYQLLWKNQRDLYIVLFLNAVNAVLNDCYRIFRKRRCHLLLVDYFFLNALAEVSSTIEARSILAKQHKLGIIHPVAFVIGQTISEIPVAVFQSLVFSCCYYFLLGLNKTASDFWIFELILFIHYSAVSSLFRMLGAWAPNLNIAFFMAGTAMPICLTYAGYSPPVPSMHKWGSWIRRISPSPWALEALRSNEFADIDLYCTADQMIPYGPGYDDMQYQGCSLPGSTKGHNVVSGSTYIDIIYNFSRSHLWRNFGIIVVMWFIYVVLTAIGLTVMTDRSGNGGGPVFKRGAIVSDHVSSEKTPDDLERNATTGITPLEPVSSNSSVTQVEDPTATENTLAKEKPDIESDQRTFSFTDVCYFVDYDGNERQLLNNVSGYVKPGQLTALMGASGAGKTTLLDTISQRKEVGRVEGQMLMGGMPLDETFSRSCGFCMQQDIHEPLTTVREALQFSAKLRQPSSVPLKDKLSHVESIISLLELESIADALIGEPGDSGLNVEERKRVTIGVELAAKPSWLLFLDEPTSGLDSQAAYSIVSFLQKIAEQGVPIVCTIHQPSAVLFHMFDHVLLLAPGGRTVSFGETGPHSRHVIDYFSRHGANMSASENPAEFIISTVTSKAPDAKNWPQIWKDSKECSALQHKIANLVQRGQQHSPNMMKERSNSPYALPLWAQIVELSHRHWIVVWRNGP